MTRIIAGSARGHTLKVPVRGTRPTSDRVREAIFSRLTHLDALIDARVLDLYAGSGALGLEALSRGAASAVFVEAHAPAARVCAENIAALKVGGRATVIQAKVRTFLAENTPDLPFHTVLIDPPYGLEETAEVLAELGRWLSPEAVIMWEQSIRATPVTWPAPFIDLGSKTYGQTRVSFAELPS